MAMCSGPGCIAYTQGMHTTVENEHIIHRKRNMKDRTLVYLQPSIDDSSPLLFSIQMGADGQISDGHLYSIVRTDRAEQNT